MPVQFKIKVTKEILELSKECGTHHENEIAGNNCAIAVAVKHIFPDVFVSGHYIYPFGHNENDKLDELKIALPKIAHDFVNVFDSLCVIYKQRLLLPEFEFEISISDQIIAQINIDEVRSLTGSPFCSTGVPQL